MKIKQSILFVLGVLLISATYAQGVSNKSFKPPVIIAESGIKHITASGNVDILLINVNDDEEVIKNQNGEEEFLTSDETDE